MRSTQICSPLPQSQNYMSNTVYKTKEKCIGTIQMAPPRRFLNFNFYPKIRAKKCYFLVNPKSTIFSQFIPVFSAIDEKLKNRRGGAIFIVLTYFFLSLSIKILLQIWLQVGLQILSDPHFVLLSLLQVLGFSRRFSRILEGS